MVAQSSIYERIRVSPASTDHCVEGSRLYAMLCSSSSSMPTRFAHANLQEQVASSLETQAHWLLPKFLY